jgi:hypothetical protein
VIDRAEIHERQKRAALTNASEGPGSGSPANGVVNGKVLEDADDPGEGEDRSPTNDNVATLKLRR